MSFGYVASVLVFLSLFIFAPFSSARDDAYYETSCPFDTSTILVSVRCGILTVPENRSNPNSRSIVLTVMTAESSNPAKFQDPVIYLAGGPGESAIAAMMPVFSSEQGVHLVQDRDWIIVDQRGTGYSVPRLDCNIFGIARLVSPDALTEASQVCWERHSATGIDLTGYTIYENAADIADLRNAMGIDAWNLFGVSYGTTLALTIMQNDPDGLRAVVLDSTLPPQNSFFISDVEAKADTLQRLFDACQQDIPCQEAYPDLADRFNEAVNALNEQPLDIDGLSVNGDFLVFALTNTGVFQRDVIASLPYLLDQLLSGDAAGLGALLGATASGSDSESGYETDLVAANDGMGLAMNCTRDALFPGVRQALVQMTEQDAVRAALARLYLRYLDACSVWNALLDTINIPDAVRSDIPALLLVGEWDPSTPFSRSQETAETLARSTINVFPGQGHSVVMDGESACATEIMNAFLNAPEDSPDSACITEDYPPISFRFLP